MEAINDSKNAESLHAESGDSQISNLEKQKSLNKELQDKIDDLEAENAIFETQNNRLIIKVTNLQITSDKYEDENYDYALLLNDLEVEIEGHLKTISELTNQNDQLWEAGKELEATKEEEIEELKKEVETLKGSLIQAEAKLRLARTLEPNRPGIPTVGSATTVMTQGTIEAQQRFQRLLIDSTVIEEKIKRDFIKSKDDIDKLKSYMIKEAVGIKGRTNQQLALNSITEFQQSLRYFKSDIDCGIIPDTQEYRKRIDAEIEKQNLLKKAVEETNRNMIQAGEDRNIRLIEMNHVDSKLLSKNTPSFTGEGSLHIFMWLKIMDTYLKSLGVLPEDSSVILKEHCKGKPRSILDRRFSSSATPSPSDIKKALVSHFGNRAKILIEIQSEHNALGTIPHPCQVSTFSMCFLLTEKHLDLLQKASILTEETIYDKQKIVPVQLRDINLKAYSETILHLLPPDYIRGYRVEMRDKSPSDSDILAKLKETLEDIKRTAFENEQSVITDSGREPKKLVTSYTAQTPFLECPICRLLKRDHNRDPPTRNHAYYEDKNGRRCVKPESCSFIAELDIIERREFCNKFSLCPICLIQKEDSTHNRNNCDFVQRCQTFKCRSPDCGERYSLCFDHQYMNIEALERTQRSLKEDNCDFTW